MTTTRLVALDPTAVLDHIETTPRPFGSATDLITRSRPDTLRIVTRPERHQAEMVGAVLYADGDALTVVLVRGGASVGVATLSGAIDPARALDTIARLLPR